MNTFIDPTIIGPQLIWGWLVKKWPALKKWPNRLIPVFNFILGLLIEFGKVGIAEAQVVANPIQPNIPWWMHVVKVLINTWISSGMYTTTQSVSDHMRNEPYPRGHKK